MKVFVYSKKTDKKLAQVDGVTAVETKGKGEIKLHTASDETFTFNTKEVKTTIYQN